MLDFIEGHPGLSKKQIVDSPEIISNVGTRNPVFRYLSNLEEYGFLRIIPDESNSQIHHVFINDENRIIRVIQDMEEFEKSYLSLLHDAKKKFFRIKMEDRKSAYDLLMSISSLNTHFIGIYIILVVYVCPGKSVKEIPLID